MSELNYSHNINSDKLELKFVYKAQVKRRTSHEPNFITVWVDPNCDKFASWVKRPNLTQPNLKKLAIPVVLSTHTLT